MNNFIFIIIFLFNLLMGNDDMFVYTQSTSQAFYLIDKVLINGHLIESDDWVVAFNPLNDVCVGARQWDTSLCGGGICDVPVMGDDGPINGENGEEVNPNMDAGEIPEFKVFDSSEGELIDMSFYNEYPNVEDFSYNNNSFFLLSELINNDYSFNNNPSDFENTATITSIVSDDEYSMGPNDILVGYIGDEVRSIAISANNNIASGYVFFSSIFLNTAINDLSFKYYNYENKLFFNINQLFSLDIDDSLGDAKIPIVLNIDESQNLNILNNAELIDNFSISNVYPNPFNPILNINFNVYNNNYIEISIVDINGQKVDQIFTGYKTQGEYNYKWDATNFTSGIYFIIIKEKVNGEVLSEKICLIK